MEKVPGGPRCKWVQKQECIDVPITRPKCEHPPNQMCVVCDTFRRDNGFGSCPTNNCGSFVPGIHLIESSQYLELYYISFCEIKKTEKYEARIF